jgi:sec-independent protein translocase protein TatC
VLFIAGAAFAYYAIFPLAFPFFLDVLDVEVSLSISGYLKAIVKMMIAFGVCFQLPVVSWFLARMGVIDHIDMTQGFRYAVPVIFLFAAILTPPDPLTQTALGIPLIFLYGVGIIVAYFASTKVREEG